MATDDGADVRAAGVVLWRGEASGPVVALVHRPRYDDWSLPKGKLDPGETEREAARREAVEETGHRGELGASLGEIRYQVPGDGGLEEKVVTYWEMRAGDGRFRPGPEVDRLRWLGLEDAIAAVSYEGDREILHRFARIGWVHGR
jgi:8-oxo-(d)GTP phosphatase